MDATKVGIWVYRRDDAERLTAAARTAIDRLFKPDLEGASVSARADHVTVQVVRGALEDPTSILYVEGRGTFEVLRVEAWPGARALLVLRAWPSRGA
jgi:hypothetical protein